PRRPGRPRISSGHLGGETAPASEEAELLEIPWAVRWLVPQGERFANYDVVNDNDSQLEYASRYGPIYAVGIPTKKWRLVMVSDPDLLDEVADDADQFGKRVEDINFFDQLAGPRADGISEIGDGEHYDRVRRVMLPWYAPANQKTQFGRMKAVAAQMLAAWEQVPEDEPVDLRDWMTRYALEISGRGACNYDFGTMKGGKQLPALATAVIESTRESIARIAESRPDFTIFSGLKKRRRKRLYHKHNARLYESTQMLVGGRIGTCPVGEQNDLLSRLVTTPDPDTETLLDVRTVRDQILMHFSNGFNGPAIIGAWLPYVISQHPEVEERLIAEIDSVTRGNPDYDLPYKDLMAMPYATQVIKETLRIYPPMPVTIRRSLKDGPLGGYRIRKDDIILVGSLAAHRDPRYWGERPDQFDPDHFSMERVVERPRHAFIPFSVGVRQCMAQEVTFMTLRIALFSIYNRYRLSLAPGESVVKNTVATTKSGPVRMLRSTREGREEREAAVATRRQKAQERGESNVDRSWDRPSEIPEASTFGHLVIAYGSNFGTCKDLAERFAERSHIFG
ncbi:MAG: cytochrome P450, partial [Sciscionella sp.]